MRDSSLMNCSTNNHFEAHCVHIFAPNSPCNNQNKTLLPSRIAEDSPAQQSSTAHQCQRLQCFLVPFLVETAPPQIEQRAEINVEDPTRKVRPTLVLLAIAYP